MALQFKIQLKNITQPPVWRRVIVPEQFTFLRFHNVIQASFGWRNTHLFVFSPKGYGSEPAITMPGKDWYPEPVVDCQKTKLIDIFDTPGQKFTYIYDFGDDWIHTITLEEITPEEIKRADCIAGKSACPPDDCGGPMGYGRLRFILDDPKHSEHKDMKKWVGLSKDQSWDAGLFDLEASSVLVREI